MADQIVFASAETGPEAPVADADPNAAATVETSTEAQGDRPSWLPDNFKTPEDFRKSFDDQRAELTRLQQEAAAKTKEAPPADETPEAKATREAKEAEDAKANAAPDISKLTEGDFEKFSLELAESGTLTEDSRAEIKKQINAPDWMIDTYIAGIKAQNDAANSAVVNAFGGAEAQKEIFQWAGQALSDDELATVNKQLSSKDMNSVLFAADALKTKYEAANGKAPARKLSGNPNVTASAYQSWEQVNKDMADPRYKSDPAFRAQVKEKLRGFN